MKRAIIGLLLIIIQAYSFTIKAQNSETFSTINFWVSADYANTLNLQLALNNQRITSFKSKQLIQYKMYSSGLVNFEIFNSGAPFYNQQIEIKNGETYNICMRSLNPFVLKHTIEVLDEAAAKKIFSDPKYFKQKYIFEEDIRNPLVPLTKEQLAQKPRSGSAFLISKDGFIITNHHVIDKANKITVKGINGDYSTTYLAKVVIDDKNNDIAILQLENKSVSFNEVPFTIRSNSGETGEEIFTLGYPLIDAMGEEIKLTTGVISAKTGYQGDISSYQVSAPVQPGNSGGPLFDKQGNLVGIINAKVNGAENASYAIKNNYLNTLLDLLPTKPSLNQKASLNNLSLQEQVKSLSKFVYIVEVNN